MCATAGTHAENHASEATDGIACGFVGSCATPNRGLSHELVGVPRMVGVRGAIPALCVCVCVCESVSVCACVASRVVGDELQD
jgi:hypothetical protein